MLDMYDMLGFKLESFVVCIVGKWHKTQGGYECVVVSFPSSLVGFQGFHSHMHLFPFGKVFVTCFSCFFCVLLFGNGKREERWEGAQVH